MKNFPKITQSTEEIFLHLYDKHLLEHKFLLDSMDSEIANDLIKHRLIEQIDDSEYYSLTSFGLDFAKILVNKHLRSNVLKKMTLEDYLLAIYYIVMSKADIEVDYNVVTMTEIARYLGLSNSSISEYIRIIEKENFINVIPRKGVILTSLGQEKVIRLLAKRETLTEFFNSILKIDFDLADVESHVLEHNVSLLVIERLSLLIKELKNSNFSLKINE